MIVSEALAPHWLITSGTASSDLRILNRKEEAIVVNRIEKAA